MHRRRLLPISLLAVVAAAGLVTAVRLPDASAADPVTVLASDFEDGAAQGWAPRGTAEVVANSTIAAHGGTHSLSTTGRTASWNGPSRSVLDTMQEGTAYTLSVWARLADGEATTPMRMSVERRLGTTANFDTVVNNVSVSSTAWTQLTGTYTRATTVDLLSVYVESASGTPSFLIDDFSMSYVPALPIQTDIPALKTVFASDFAMGAAVGRPQLLAERADLLRRHFSSVTPGNAMKWDATEPTEGSFAFTDADAIVNFAVANGIKVRGHTLAWHNQTPAWVFQDASGATMTPTAANKTLLLSRLQNHINTVVGRYKGQVYAWDVVNEVLNEDGTLRNSMWYQITGLDYIVDAFTWAHAADPAAQLCINDYNLTVAAKRDGMYTLVSQLKAQGVPVDCVGSQMHGNISWPTAADTAASIEKFAQLGVDQQITEMDVSVYTDNTSSYTTIPDAALAEQATRYQALFDVYRSHQADISSVTLWGLSDDDSWLNSFPISRLDAPLLFDRQLQAKSAYYAVTGATPPSSSPTASAPASPPASATASPTGSPGAAAACRVTYAVTGQWSGGFQADVKITNTGAVAINGWTLRWNFANGQQISQLWNGTASQSGTAVTVTNVSYNGMISAGATASVGFLASWNGTNTAPTAFTVNDATCTA